MIEERVGAGMNLRVLQTEAHAIAVAKGWWDTERTFGDLISLVHSEMSEALEAYREQGLETSVRAKGSYSDPDEISLQTVRLVGVAYELADVMIRVVDLSERYGVWADAAYQRASAGGNPIPQLETLGDWGTYVHYWASKTAWEYWQARAEGEEDIPYWADAIGEVIRGVVYMAAHCGIDLDAAIDAKMEYLRGRA